MVKMEKDVESKSLRCSIMPETEVDGRVFTRRAVFGSPFSGS